MKITCPFCGEKISNSQRFLIGIKLSYLICGFCGGGVLYPKSKDKSLSDLYNSEVYFDNLAVPFTNKFLNWLFSIRIFLLPHDWIKKDFKKGKILDVGCGNGEFLYELKKDGWDVYGSDISYVSKRRTEEKIGRNKVKVGTFFNLKYKHDFDIISFWHVLEHVEDPLRHVKKAFDLLNNDGVIVGEVPNFDSLVLRIFGRYYCWLMIPEHCLYFNKQSLETLLKRAGFKEVSIHCPRRALSNFSQSLLNRFFGRFKLERRSSIRLTLTLVFMPISILVISLSSIFLKGEVLRFSARK